MTWRGRPVRPEAIRDTALLAVEGERDETCPAGQTRAALGLCPALDPKMRRHHLQPGAGHDDLFEGPIWTTEVYPVVREVIQSHN
jgi:poly(3-hydroxybutyrate) depolymerase